MKNIKRFIGAHHIFNASILIFIFLFAILLHGCAANQKQILEDTSDTDATEKIIISEVKVYQKSDGAYGIQIVSNGFLKYSYSKKTDPLRLEILCPDAWVAKSDIMVINDGSIQTIQMENLRDDSLMASISIILDQDFQFKDAPTQEGLLIDFISPIAQNITFDEVSADESFSISDETTADKKSRAVLSINAYSNTQHDIVELLTDGQVSKFKTMILSDPSRLVIDLKGIKDGIINPPEINLDNKWIKSIRYNESKEKLRVVVDTTKPILPKYDIITTKDSLKILFSKDNNVTATSTRTKFNKVEKINFQVLDNNNTRIVVKTLIPSEYYIFKDSDNSLTLVLEHCTIPKWLQRDLITSQFQSAVKLVSPLQDSAWKNKVLIKISLREMVPYQDEQKDGEIWLEFDPYFGSITDIKLPAPVDIDITDGTITHKQDLLIEPSATAGVPSEEVLTADVLFEDDQEGRTRYIGEPISIDIQQADIHNLFRLLTDLSGLNLLVEEGVKGTVTMKLKDVPWDQVLDLILTSNNLAMSKDGNVLRIAPAEKIKKEKQILADAKKAEQDLAPLITEHIQINYAKASDLISKIKEIQSDRGKINNDERTNMLIIKDIAENLTEIRELISILDKPTPQVMIEARFVILTEDGSREIGVAWGGDMTRTLASEQVSAGGNVGGYLVNLLPATGAGGVGFTLGKLFGDTVYNLDVQLKALESQGNGEIISSPRVLTMDNKEATIKQGTMIPYQEESSSGGTTTNFIEAVLELKIKPHVTPDNRISMKIDAKKDAPTGGGNPPSIGKREISTELLVNNGETIVIGGVIDKSKSISYTKVPLFGNIPILGWLFKTKTNTIVKNELLIFITPRIVTL